MGPPPAPEAPAGHQRLSGRDPQRGPAATIPSARNAILVSAERSPGDLTILQFGMGIQEVVKIVEASVKERP